MAIWKMYLCQCKGLNKARQRENSLRTNPRQGIRAIRYIKLEEESIMLLKANNNGQQKNIKIDQMYLTFTSSCKNKTTT
jgi:hypothetical protein